MFDEYVDPSPLAVRKRRLVWFGVFVLLVMGVGVYVAINVTISPDSCIHNGLRDFFIFKVATILFGASILAYQAYKMLTAGQLPTPTAVIFRRTRVRRGSYVKRLALAYLAGSGLLLFVAGALTAIFVTLLVVTPGVALCT